MIRRNAKILLEGVLTFESPFEIADRGWHAAVVSRTTGRERLDCPHEDHPNEQDAYQCGIALWEGLPTS